MHCIVNIACSLDGYIAGRDGNLEWLTCIPGDPGDDYGYALLMERTDAILMGRNTFITVTGFDRWPYGKPVYVFSNTLKALPREYEGRTELVGGTVEQVCRLLESQGVRTLYVDGGRTIRGFLEEDRIDEMIITTVSKILGGGIPLFGPMDRALDFEVTESRRLNGYLSMNRYLRRRAP